MSRHDRLRLKKTFYPVIRFHTDKAKNRPVTDPNKSSQIARVQIKRGLSKFLRLCLISYTLNGR